MALCNDCNMPVAVEGGPHDEGRTCSENWDHLAKNPPKKRGGGGHVHRDRWPEWMERLHFGDFDERYVGDPTREQDQVYREITQ